MIHLHSLLAFSSHLTSISYAFNITHPSKYNTLKHINNNLIPPSLVYPLYLLIRKVFVVRKQRRSSLFCVFKVDGKPTPSYLVISFYRLVLTGSRGGSSCVLQPSVWPTAKHPIPCPMIPTATHPPSLSACIKNYKHLTYFKRTTLYLLSIPLSIENTITLRSPLRLPCVHC